MILKLTIECVCGPYLQEQWIRIVEIHEGASLYDLHNVIQNAVEFDRDHPYEYFLANSPSSFARREQLAESDCWYDLEEEFANIRLSDVYPLGRRRLYYLFDFGDNWLFEIRMRQVTKPPTSNVRYPRIVERIGPNPEQYSNMDE